MSTGGGLITGGGTNLSFLKFLTDFASALAFQSGFHSYTTVSISPGTEGTSSSTMAGGGGRTSSSTVSFLLSVAFVKLATSGVV